MTDKILIAVDAGKSETKAIAKYNGKKCSVSFRTKLQRVAHLGLDIQPKSYHIQYLGNEYLLGDMVSEDFADFSLTKASLVHQLSIYNAIAQLLQKAKVPKNVVIHLAVNVPITTYKDAIQKEKFKQMIENQDRNIHLISNGKAFSFQLCKITIGFEGMGEVYARTADFRGGSTIVVDVGGLNASFCRFRGIHPQYDSMCVSEKGTNVLKGKIGKVINERYGVSVSSDDLEMVLRNGYFSNRGQIFEGSKVFIEEIKYDHLQQIIQFAQSRRYTFNNADILFVGGGSITLNRYIKSEFPYATIAEDPKFANCRSFLQILEIKNAQG